MANGTPSMKAVSDGLTVEFPVGRYGHGRSPIVASCCSLPKNHEHPLTAKLRLGV
jgi:hypothetical protein